jgi:hypothetical protein
MYQSRIAMKRERIRAGQFDCERTESEDVLAAGMIVCAPVVEAKRREDAIVARKYESFMFAT